MKAQGKRTDRPAIFSRLVMMVIACIAVGCAHTDRVPVAGPMEQSTQAQALEAEDSEIRSCLPVGRFRPNTVSARWIAPSNDAYKFTDHLFAVIENLSDDEATVNLLFFGMSSLVGRPIYVPIAPFTLSGRETKDIRMRMEDLPVQSVGHPSRYRLGGTYLTPTLARGSFQRDADIYVQFAPDYTEAYASTDSAWAVVALGLAGGNVLSPEYAQLRDDPVSTIRVRAGGRVTEQIDATKAKEMFKRVMVPRMLPRGRRKDETGQFVDVPASPVSGIMSMLEDRHFRDIENATAQFGEDILRELLGYPPVSSGIENDKEKP